MTTVFDGLMAIAQRLPQTVRGIATAGGEDETHYIYVDDLDTLVHYADNTFIGGTLLIETGDCAGAVLPVRDSIQTTGRVLGDQRFWTQTVAEEVPAEGDVFMVTAGLYGAAQLLMALREALRAWGFTQSRELSGTGDGIATTFWHALTGDVEVTRVIVTTKDGDEAIEYHYWEPVALGTTLGVELTYPPAKDATVELIVRYPAEDAVILPPTKTTLDDELGNVSAEFLGFYGGFACLRAAVGAPGQDQDVAIKLMNYYAEQAETTRLRFSGRGPRGRERLMRGGL